MTRTPWLESPIIESCVDSVTNAIRAEQNGADRLELCADLHLDGLTPPLALLQAVQTAVNIPVKVMIRPRAGDFTYDDSEKVLIRQDIDMCKALGINDFVYGSLKEGRLDIEDIKAFHTYAQPRSLTIHKAIDYSEAIIGDVMQLVKWSRQLPQDSLSILSSGGEATAENGIATLVRMLSLTQNKVELIVAGKVTKSNLDKLKKILPAPAFHGRNIVS